MSTSTTSTSATNTPTTSSPVHPVSTPFLTPSSLPYTVLGIPNKSPNDPRTYLAIELPNNLRVLLISDPHTQKAAAALDVGIGHQSDGWVSGIAHFCEHMLFLGTKKYPKEGEYQGFLDSHGGFSNAFTSDKHTNYYFSVSPHHFYDALDRFSQFFIAPLFNSDMASREKNAVHNEYSRNSNTDSRRAYQLQKVTSNPLHPFSQFGSGNKYTFGDDPTAIREALLDFHTRHYSATNMTLVLLGRESLEELGNWALELFSHVPSHPIRIPTLDFPPNPWLACDAEELNRMHEKLGVNPTCFLPNVLENADQGVDRKALEGTCASHTLWKAGPVPPCQVYDRRRGKKDALKLPPTAFYPGMEGRICSFVPIRALREVKVRWILPPQLGKLQTRPAEVISHVIGHEGPKSLLSYLKHDLQLVQSLSCGAGNDDCADFSFFSVTISLTTEGEKQVWKVISALVSHLAMLQCVPDSIWKDIVEEDGAIAQQNWRFQAKEDESDYVSDLAESMHVFSPDYYGPSAAPIVKWKEEEKRARFNTASASPPPLTYLLDLPFHFRGFSPQEVVDYLQAFQFERMRVDFASQTVAGHTTHVEPHYGTAYRVDPIPELVMSDFRKLQSIVDVQSSHFRTKAQKALDALQGSMGPLVAYTYASEEDTKIPSMRGSTANLSSLREVLREIHETLSLSPRLGLPPKNMYIAENFAICRTDPQEVLLERALVQAQRDVCSTAEIDPESTVANTIVNPETLMYELGLGHMIRDPREVRLRRALVLEIGTGKIADEVVTKTDERESGAETTNDNITNTKTHSDSSLSSNSISALSFTTTLGVVGDSLSSFAIALARKWLVESGWLAETFSQSQSPLQTMSLSSSPLPPSVLTDDALLNALDYFKVNTSILPHLFTRIDFITDFKNSITTTSFPNLASSTAVDTMILNSLVETALRSEFERVLIQRIPIEQRQSMVYSTSTPTPGEPTLIHVSPSLIAWFKTDTIFEQPKTTVQCCLYSNPGLGVQSAVNLSMLSSMFSDFVNEKFYNASIAGLNYRVSSNRSCLSLIAGGYSDKLPTFWADFISALQEFVAAPDPIRFETIKELHIRSLMSQMATAQADSHAREIVTDVLFTMPISLQDKLSQYHKLSFDKFVKSVQDYVRDCTGEMLIYGNESTASSSSFAQITVEKLGIEKEMKNNNPQGSTQKTTTSATLDPTFPSPTKVVDEVMNRLLFGTGYADKSNEDEIDIALSTTSPTTHSNLSSSSTLSVPTVAPKIAKVIQDLQTEYNASKRHSRVELLGRVERITTTGGNPNTNDAVNVDDKLETCLGVNIASAAATISSIISPSYVYSPHFESLRRLLIIRPRETVFVRDYNRSSLDSNSATRVYFQLGDPEVISTNTHSLHNQKKLRWLKPATELFVSIISDHVYGTLRTKEQLGYVVHSGNIHFRSINHVVFSVQSSTYSAHYLQTRIDECIRGLRKIIEDLTDEQLLSHINAVVEDFCDVPKQPSVLADLYWAEITCGRGDFGVAERDLDAYRRVTRDMILEIYDRYISVDAPERRMICGQVFAARFTIPEDPLTETTETPMISEETLKEIVMEKEINANETIAVKDVDVDETELLEDDETTSHAPTSFTTILERPVLNEEAEEAATTEIDIQTVNTVSHSLSSSARSTLTHRLLRPLVADVNDITLISPYKQVYGSSQFAQTHSTWPVYHLQPSVGKMKIHLMRYFAKQDIIRALSQSKPLKESE